jgi:hypothetical protein
MNHLRTAAIVALGLALASVALASTASTPKPAAAAPEAAPDAASPAAKVTIGIVLPKAQLGQGNNGTDVAEPVRRTLLSYLAGPELEIVPLEARIPIQIAAEAREKHCAYVLYTAVEQQKGANVGGLFRKIAPIAGALPMLGAMGAMGGAGGGMMAGAAASAVAQGAMSASAMSAQQDMMERMTGAQKQTVKAGDSVTFEYRLVAPGSAEATKADKLSLKAKNDGEDLLSPLIEQVANAVVTVASAPH